VVLVSTAEFTLKSHPVRQQLTRLLKRHIRFNLKRIGLENCRITQAGGFLIIADLEDEDADRTATEVSQIFGVAHADACQPTRLDLDAIAECAANQAQRKLKPGDTFAIRARGFEPSKIKGKEIEIRSGSEVLSRHPGRVKVDLSNPNHTIRVFYGLKEAFVSSARFDGPGGLPVGSQGSLLGLAADPALAPLAFWLLMKRGAMVWPVIAELFPLGGASSDQVLEGLRRIRRYVPKKTYSARLIRLDEGARNALTAVSPAVQRVFCTRLAFRAVEHLARNALGLVTADRFGRGGLESLKDLRAADEVATFPVYRPLLTLDEEDMRRRLEELGLAQPETQKTTPWPPSGLDEPLVDEVRTLENRLQADQLAHNMAVDSRKIQIDFP
jgi:thiamine biosynthesis protein ThiI